MSAEPFILEWFGGAAEFHYRKARPDDEFDWESLKAADYPPAFAAAAREVWMGVVVAEYAAIAAFADVVGALTAARAPLDLIGMTSDFLADEVRHVELASRLVMRLGGAPLRYVDVAQLAPRTPTSRTPLERANELALRIGCIAEVFASETAVPMMRATTHPLVRSVYASILKDEARHRRFGSLYFEWAGERLTPGEQVRLGTVAVEALQMYAALYRPKDNDASASDWQGHQGNELGWFERERYTPVAEGAVRDEIIPALLKLGLVLPSQSLDQLFTSGSLT